MCEMKRVIMRPSEEKNPGSPERGRKTGTYAKALLREI